MFFLFLFLPSFLFLNRVSQGLTSLLLGIVPSHLFLLRADLLHTLFIFSSFGGPVRFWELLFISSLGASFFSFWMSGASSLISCLFLSEYFGHFHHLRSVCLSSLFLLDLDVLLL